MKILMVSAEAVPFAKTGGLAFFDGNYCFRIDGSCINSSD